MQSDTNFLYEIEGRLNEAVVHLHEQQDIVATLDSTIAPNTLLRLHSIALRQFTLLEKERERLGELIFRAHDECGAKVISRDFVLCVPYDPDTLVPSERSICC
jgi:hypothetical protein